jgi:hypothetical protein
MARSSFEIVYERDDVGEYGFVALGLRSRAALARKNRTACVHDNALGLGATQVDTDTQCHFRPFIQRA